MQNERGILAVLAFSLTILFQAVPAGAQTLSDALVAAVRSSTDLASARAEAMVLAERVIQARAGGRVQVQGTIDFGAEYGRFERLDDRGALALTATQPIYTGGQVENATEAALTRMAAQKARIAGIEQAVLLDAATSYLDVLRDRALIKIAEETSERIAAELAGARARYDLGEGTRTDVAQAEARLAASESVLAARRGALAVSREAFRRDIGAYPEALTDPPPIPDLPDDREHAVAIALREAPAVAAARLERLAAGDDVRAAIGALLPQVAMVARVSRSNLPVVLGDWRTDAVIGLQVTFPFYSGGFNYSRVRESQAIVEGLDAGVSASLLNTTQRVGTAWADLEVARARIEAGVIEVASAQLAVTGVRSEAEVGARTTLDVLNAERELLDARAALTIAQRDEYVAALELLFSIGKLSVEHLGLNMHLTDPVAAYYAEVEDREFGYPQSDDTVWTVTYRP